MTKKSPRIGKSQIAGGVKVQLPIDSPLIGVLKTDQYDIVNLYTNEVDKTYVATDPGDGDPDGPGPEDPGPGGPVYPEPTVFPNPIIEIGDIVEISYPNNLVYSSEDAGKTAGKYIILDVEQGYSQSPSTRITCRSIYV